MSGVVVGRGVSGVVVGRGVSGVVVGSGVSGVVGWGDLMDAWDGLHQYQGGG